MVSSGITEKKQYREQTLLLEGKLFTAKDVEEVLERVHNCDVVLMPEYKDLFDFLLRWFDDEPTITVHTSGSTGTPKDMKVSKERMIFSARMTCRALSLQPGNTALLCMNLRYIGAMMVVVRALVAGLNLVVRPVSGHPLTEPLPAVHFAAMVPLQIYNTLQVPVERERLRQVACLIIGGGSIHPSLLPALQQLGGAVYSTYGMTETLSHIALRRLNGSDASFRYFPLPGVQLSLSSEGTLIIDVPDICEYPVCTNDVAELYPDGSFVILGRKDNIINSGGIKIQTEMLEEKLQAFLTVSFAVTAVPDVRLGEAVTLLVVSETDFDSENLTRLLRAHLSPYECPRHIFRVGEIPQAGNGKINRKLCRELALQFYLRR